MQVREAKDGFVDVALNLGHILHVQQSTVRRRSQSTTRTWCTSCCHALLPPAATADEAGRGGGGATHRRPGSTWARALLPLGAARRGGEGAGRGGQAEGELERFGVVQPGVWRRRSSPSAVLRKRVEERTLEEVQEGVSGRLEEAERTFTALERASRRQHRRSRRRGGRRRGGKRKRRRTTCDDARRGEEGEAPGRHRCSFLVLLLLLLHVHRGRLSTRACHCRCPSPVSCYLLPPALLDLQHAACFRLQEKALAHAAVLPRHADQGCGAPARLPRREKGELAQIAERARKAKEEADGAAARLEREEREAQGEGGRGASVEEVAQQLNKEQAGQPAGELDHHAQGRGEGGGRETTVDADGEEGGPAEAKKRKGKKKKASRGSASDDDDRGDEEGATARPQALQAKEDGGAAHAGRRPRPAGQTRSQAEGEERSAEDGGRRRRPRGRRGRPMEAPGVAEDTEEVRSSGSSWQAARQLHLQRGSRSAAVSAPDGECDEGGGGRGGSG